MPGKVDTWTAVSRRMYDHHHSLKWKTKQDTCLRVIGVTEFDANQMPKEWLAKILKSLERGCVLSTKGPWLNVLNFICDHNPIEPISVGYVGRQQIAVAYPPVAPIHEFMDELNTLAELTFGERTFRMRGLFNGWTQVIGEQKTKRGRHTYTAPAATMTRVRRVVYQQLQKTLSSREPIIDWLFSENPVIRIPFASHTKDWKRRN